jgi:Kef-type K+ transport system membrane component KefB
LALHDWSLPVRSPVFLFSMLMLTILVAPALLQRFKLPGLVGFILAGALLGPHGINLLEKGEGMRLMATGGLLYIMSWAGLEINLASFYRTRHRSVSFGMLTFLLPLVIGGLSSWWLLGLDPAAALLLAGMFSTHTLLSYPIVNRLRLVNNEAVTIAVGGTIITDTLALLLLTIVAAAEQGAMSFWFWLKLLIGLSLFTAFAFYILPKISRWFFQRVESDLTYQFVFVLAVVFSCGVIAELAGLEAIIGAFVAGLVLNRLIPQSSPLMERIEFVGNAIFIPAFLFYVGMIINLNVFFKSEKTILIALVLTTIALLTKWLAALATQRLFGYTTRQRNLIFGLSSSHAAATIAIILIGFEIKLFDEEILNATIFLILVTCLVSTYVTDRTARKMVTEKAVHPPAAPENGKVNKILVPFSNPETVTRLVDFSILLKSPEEKEPVFPLSIILDEKNARQKIQESRQLMEPLLKHAQEQHLTLSPIQRVDVSAVSGISRAAKEILATDIVIGWSPRLSATEKFFGTTYDNLLEETTEMVFVVHFTRLPSSFKRIVVYTGPEADREPGFKDLTVRLVNLSRQLKAPLQLVSTPEVFGAFGQCVKERPPEELSLTEFTADSWERIHERVNEGDMVVIVSARIGSVSYREELEQLPAYLADHFAERSFVMVFPAI